MSSVNPWASSESDSGSGSDTSGVDDEALARLEYQERVYRNLMEIHEKPAPAFCPPSFDIPWLIGMFSAILFSYITWFIASAPIIEPLAFDRME